MSNLTNSKRVSYKATYNQVSPIAAASAMTGRGGNGKASGKPGTISNVSPQQTGARPFEKAAFIQTLDIAPTEAAALRGIKLPRNSAAVTQQQLATAISAISALVADQSSTSTLNNAKLFRAVEPAALSMIVNHLIAQRQTLADTVTRLIADIVTAYRNSLTPSTPVAATTAVRSRQQKLPAGTTQTSGATVAGIPITTTVTTSPLVKKAGSSKVASQSFGIHVSIDESRPIPANFSSVVSGSVSKAFAPSADQAITWSAKYAANQFSSLVDALLPHMGISQEYLEAAGPADSAVAFLKGRFAGKTNIEALQGSSSLFDESMRVQPVGSLHLERIEMYPAGVERGELIYSLPLTPGETVNVSHKEWAITERDFTDIVQDSFEGYSEQGVADKTDVGMSTDSQFQHATALNVGASLSASYSSVTLSTSFGFNSTFNESQSRKDSRNHSISITKQASARTRKDHKTTFKVTSVAGSEDQSVRVISNPSTTNAMRVDYYQLARKWKIDLLRYGMRMTYDIVIPNPGSGIVTLVNQAASLNAMIEVPFSFTLPLTALWYNSLATDPHNISNYDQLAAEYGASVSAAPEARKYVNAENHIAEVTDYDHVHYDSIKFSIDENYYIYDCVVEYNFQNTQGDPSVFTMLDGSSIVEGANALIGLTGDLSMDIVFQYVYNYAINIIFICRPQVQYLLDWRLQTWNQLRLAAQDQYNANLQTYKDQLASLEAQIANFDALTLRRMEQEEIMKGVLRWLLGPTFQFMPTDIALLFGQDLTDPDEQDVLDPNAMDTTSWMNVLNHGEFIKFVHNAIEWENVLYFTYPYFWDDAKLWDFKKFLYHPDPTHRTFLRSGAARVVLTVRPGFNAAFATMLEGTDFGNPPPNMGPAAYPYVTIAQEMENFANTNYPGFPPANPDEDARPLLYLEQRRVWREMQFIVQLLDAAKVATGSYPGAGAGNVVPAAELMPYLNGPVMLNGIQYNGINDYNNQTNAQQLAVTPTMDPEDLLPIYAAVPTTDVSWNNPYFYKCPGDTGDYDLICNGADGMPGGTDKNADISANCEASLISTWFEYTPTAAIDIGITMTPPNVVPPEPDPAMA